MPWGRRSGLVLAGVVFSHWLLDLIVHRDDMPILPGDLGSLPRVGFGLWRVPTASALLELLIVLLGCYTYWRAAASTLLAHGRPTRRAAAIAAIMLACGLLVLGLNVMGM